MSYAHFNFNDFPTVVISFTGEKATKQNFRQYLDTIRSIYNRKEKFALIFDAQNASIPGFKFQKMQADWLAENHNLISTYCLGTSYIIPNALVRGVLKAIFAIQTQPVPYKVAENMESAQHFTSQLLVAAGNETSISYSI